MYGAGDENRTHDISLEGWGFTIKLHPQKYYVDNYTNVSYFVQHLIWLFIKKWTIIIISIVVEICKPFIKKSAGRP